GSDRILVVKANSGIDGTDRLVNVERAIFGDTHVAFDLHGNAGTVAKILGAVFGPDGPDNAGYVGKGLDMVDKGLSYEALAEAAIAARLGANPTPIDVVS